MTSNFVYSLPHDFVFLPSLRLAGGLRCVGGGSSRLGPRVSTGSTHLAVALRLTLVCFGLRPGLCSLLMRARSAWIPLGISEGRTSLPLEYALEA